MNVESRASLSERLLIEAEVGLVIGAPYPVLESSCERFGFIDAVKLVIESVSLFAERRTFLELEKRYQHGLGAGLLLSVNLLDTLGSSNPAS